MCLQVGMIHSKTLVIPAANAARRTGTTALIAFNSRRRLHHHCLSMATFSSGYGVYLLNTSGTFWGVLNLRPTSCSFISSQPPFPNRYHLEKPSNLAEPSQSPPRRIPIPLSPQVRLVHNVNLQALSQVNVRENENWTSQN